MDLLSMYAEDSESSSVNNPSNEGTPKSQKGLKPTAGLEAEWQSFESMLGESATVTSAPVTYPLPSAMVTYPSMTSTTGTISSDMLGFSTGYSTMVSRSRSPSESSKSDNSEADGTRSGVNRSRSSSPSSDESVMDTSKLTSLEKNSVSPKHSSDKLSPEKEEKDTEIHKHARSRSRSHPKRSRSRSHPGKSRSRSSSRKRSRHSRERRHRKSSRSSHSPRRKQSRSPRHRRSSRSPRHHRHSSHSPKRRRSRSPHHRRGKHSPSHRRSNRSPRHGRRSSRSPKRHNSREKTKRKPSPRRDRKSKSRSPHRDRKSRSRSPRRDRKSRSRSRDRRSRSRDRRPRGDRRRGNNRGKRDYGKRNNNQYGRNIRSRSNSPNDRFYPKRQAMTKQAKTFKEKMRQQLLKAGQLLGEKVLQSGAGGSKEVPSNLPLNSTNIFSDLSSAGNVTPQVALLQTMAAMHHKAQLLTGVTVPKYYNPAAVNPLKYAEQVQKRRLLWSKAKEPPEEPPDSQWQGTAFQADQDGKVTAKFRKLMGIKEESLDEEKVNESHMKQAEMFCRLDKEYEFARMTTHTHRGIGLGFQSQCLPDT